MINLPAGGGNDITCDITLLGDTSFGKGSTLHCIFLRCVIPLCSDNIEMDAVSQIYNIYFYVSQHNYMFQLPRLATIMMH
jgi:hypothetical protein